LDQDEATWNLGAVLKSKHFSLVIWAYLGQGNATKKTSEKKWKLAQEGLDLNDSAKRLKGT
jgi:hypothetical protein